MKKTIGILLVMLVLLLCHSTLAATKQDVIAAINSTYSVGNESFRLPQKIIDKATSFLNQREMSPEQYDKILGSIHKAVGIAQKAGTTDVTKISKEEMQQALDVVAEASRVANVNLEAELAALKNQSGTQKTKPQTSSTQEKTEKIENLETKSGEESGEGNSGEIISSSEEENAALIQTILAAASDHPEEDVGNQFHQIIAYVMVGILLVILLNILFIYLISKSKWNRIIKKVFIVFLFVVILISIYVLYYIYDRMEILKTAYELYHAFC